MPGPPPLVRLQSLRKHFPGAPRPALDGVSLDIRAGEVFGVIGRSGAGKSTLARCVNLLERPDAGQVLLGGQDLAALDGPALGTARRGIGMVFQHFNLLSGRTVAANIALPLEIAGVPARDRAARVAALLPLVGLQDKAATYPARLSGGQKQRVGIARALACNPRLLLCDEATSALDPETTGSILQLILDLRRRLGLAVLLVTHEMAVVKAACDAVAVMEDGRVIETGRVFDVFTRPQATTTRRFVSEVIGDAVPPGTLARLAPPGPGEDRRLLRVLFAGPASTRAVVSEASRRFGVDLNIVSGRIDEIGGEPFGLLALAAYGPPAALDAAVGWMSGLGLQVDALAE